MPTQQRKSYLPSLASDLVHVLLTTSLDWQFTSFVRCFSWFLKGRLWSWGVCNACHTKYWNIAATSSTNGWNQYVG